MLDKSTYLKKMQLDVEVSPPANIIKYLDLQNGMFNLDFWPLG